MSFFKNKINSYRFVGDLKTQRENLVSQLKIHIENRMKIAERQKKYDNSTTSATSTAMLQSSKPKTDGVWA